MPTQNQPLWTSNLEDPLVTEVPQVRVRAQAFQVPLVRDVAVIGVLAPVTGDVMMKILGMMSREKFTCVDIEDDTVRSIVARESVLRKIGWERMTRIVRRDVKQLMLKSEILGLKLDIEIALGENSFP
ncbi:MAG: hypothetical protein JWM88_30 [Verrucomicrobia bacterium]|nr:hypothetical protein [Verrucomicrobiota bacterium]